MAINLNSVRYMSPKPSRPTSLWTDRRIKRYNVPLRVLVVDDNHNAAEALAAFLAFERMDCRVAFGGLEAISMATAWIPHAIVMDISMPECTGFEAAFVLRQDLRTREIAIIAFTALDETEVRRHAVAGEFDGYCQKGQSPVHLTALIRFFCKLDTTP
jgi:two-component system OmpR family response regulator